MSHIHKFIDFTVVAYIVHKNKVLFIHHKELDRWLPIGGHIELDEEPEQALYREIEEETGLKRINITILSNKPNYKTPRQKFLYTPNLLDIHKINDNHKHIGIIYFVRSLTDKIKHAKDEHNQIKWLSRKDLKIKEYELGDEMFYMATKAIELEKSFK